MKNKHPLRRFSKLSSLFRYLMKIEKKDTVTVEFTKEEFEYFQNLISTNNQKEKQNG